jgi:hypothetical protein
MRNLLQAVRAAIRLDIPALARFRDSGDAFRRGVAVLLLVALVVGGVSFAVDLVAGLPASPGEAGIAAIADAFDMWTRFMPEDSAQLFQQQFLQNMRPSLELGRTLAGLPTIFPRALSAVFSTLGTWLGRPLGMLGGFLAYAIWVMLAAKLLGGQGGIQEFLGTAALSSVPYLLLVLERVPCLGSFVALVAWLWSTVIWIVTTAVAHGWAVPTSAEEAAQPSYSVHWGKPFLAVILPAAVLALLVIIAASGLAFAVALAVRAGGR